MAAPGPRMFQQVHRVVRGVAWLIAIAGGIVLIATILMICVSISGRTLAALLHSGFMQTTLPGLANWMLGFRIGPIRGDFELVEAAMAFSIFAFLGWCQITAGHATVDVFTDGLRPWLKRVLQSVIEVVFAVALVYIALQLHEGMQTQHRRRTTTMVMQVPLWWYLMAALIPAYVAAAIGCYMAVVRVVEALLNRPLIDTRMGDEH